MPFQHGKVLLVFPADALGRGEVGLSRLHLEEPDKKTDIEIFGFYRRMAFFRGPAGGGGFAEDKENVTRLSPRNAFAPLCRDVRRRVS